MVVEAQVGSSNSNSGNTDTYWAGALVKLSRTRRIFGFRARLFHYYYSYSKTGRRPETLQFVDGQHFPVPQHPNSTVLSVVQLV